MTTRAEAVKAVEAAHVLQNYKRHPVVFVRGSGSRLVDTEGREYLDLLSGIGVASLGHAHRGLADALAAQAGELLHVSNLFFHPLQGEVAARLARLSGLPRAFFCNSGTEAVEACLKFARRYWRSQGVDDRHDIVAFEGAFHGRTFGSLSVTAGEPYRTPFAPLLPGVRFVSPADPDGVRDAVTGRTAAVIVEPIQGEGGVRPIPQATTAAIAEACAATGTLLIADEVQCGLGRTGRPFYSAALGLTPDLMSVGKSLGGGFPVAAALMSEAVAAAVSYGDHGTTYGGNLLACRAALVFLDALDAGLIERVATAGRRFRQGLLIRRRLTRRVTYGTALRLAAMSAAALAAARTPGLQGVHVGTIALAVGVVVEALASRVMTRGVVAELQATPAATPAADARGADSAAADAATPGHAADAATAGDPDPAATGSGATEPTAADSAAGPAAPAPAGPVATGVRAAARPATALTMPAIFRFYLPLAMTSLLAMAVQPAVTFFVGQSRYALESLAVLPVIHGLTFLFRALGLSYQEVGIALFGDRWEQYRPIRNFGWTLAGFAAGGLGLIVFTPLATVWFEGVSGLSPELTAFALLPAQILALLPAGSVWICFQRAVLVHARQTAPITWAGIFEVAVVVLLLTVTTQVLSWVGAVGAATAIVGGRLAGVLFLMAFTARFARPPAPAPTPSPDPASAASLGG